jgi:CBS-domain-containing membrane protein
LLIEAIMTTGTAFRDVYHSPIIVGSFGASAVLVFGVPEAPLAQPRNVILGQLSSAIVGVCITKLWRITNPDYASHLNNSDFYAPSFVNGAICMAVALLVQLALGIVHPPGGATALAAATDVAIVDISWDYLPIVLASALIMVGWAMLINNVGRKRYPVYWWTPGRTFVKEAKRELRQLEEGDSDDMQHGVEFEALGENLAMGRTRGVSERHD